ncbi:MAG: extracellular solute-binding protein [Candidatus Hydrogenedentes bacterium]|nr:extracellular solute-binding protein [Candidatus Hydrogenedentota bacterium]
MEADSVRARREYKQGSAAIAWCLGVLLVVGMMLLLAVPRPSERKHPERIPVHFWHMWTSEWKTVADKIVDRYNDSQDRYEVIPLSIPANTADSKFLMSVAGGVPPDVMIQWNPVIPKWAESKAVLPLNELMSPEEWEAFQKSVYPVVLKIGMYKGKFYGAATGLDVYACYFRKDFAREAGLDVERVPRNLKELSAWGDSMTKRGPDGSLKRIGLLNPIRPASLSMYAPGFGGGFYDWKRNVLTINTSPNVQALKFLSGERKKLGFDNVIGFESSFTSEISTAAWPFISGAYGITLDGQWRVEQIARYAPEMEYGTFPIPPPEGGNELASWANANFFVIPTGAKQVDGAWDFIKFWSGIENPKRAAEFYTWGGWLPPLPAIGDAPAYREYVRQHPQFQTFLDILPSDHLEPLPPVSYQAYFWDRLSIADEAAERGLLSPEIALAQLEREIKHEVAMRRESGYDD